MASRGKRDLNLWLAVKRTYGIQSDKPEPSPYQEMLDNPASSQSSGRVRGALYRTNVTLADLKPGECGTVSRLDGNFCGRLRLLEMGLTPGTHVRMVRAAAFGGPVDIEVRGYQLSLRRAEAASVWLGEQE